MTDLAALADALDRLRDGATWTPERPWSEAMVGLEAQRNADGPVYTALAAVLRAVAERHGEATAADDAEPAGFCFGDGDDWPCPDASPILAAVEPLLALIPERTT